MTENTNSQSTEEETPTTAAETPEGEALSGEEGDLASAESDGASDMAERLAETEAALAEEKERFLRLYAEFENYKKRSAREIQEYRKYANETLIREILPIIDNLERAIHSSDVVEGDSSCIVRGVDMTLREILRVLERFHVRPVKSIGEPFDPNYHEAVGKEPSADYPEGAVMREYQRGYLLHDRLVRPSMVVVSEGGPAGAKPEAAPAAENAAAPDDANGNAE